MSLLRYPEYKDSGTEWTSQFPSHWDVQPCRYFVVEQTTKNDNAENQNYLSLMANVGVIPYEEKGDVGNKKPEDLGKCKLVAKGDLVINSMNYGIGSYGLSDLDGVCSPVYIVLRPQLDKVKARFAFRIFENKAFQTYAQSFGNGILEHRAAINWDILKGINVGLPPLSEQEVILAFLDRETAKIDVLIAEQEKLLTLLAEKRRATISHAVTKGLNPDAPMKDSGVEWLGEVPAHWLVGKAGFYISVLPGYAFPSAAFSLDESNIKLLRGINVGVGELRWDDVVFWERAENDGLEAFELREGDVVIGMDRPLISTGMRVAVVKDSDLPCLLLQRVAKIQAGPSIDSRFVMRLLSSRAFEAHFTPETTGVSVPHISGEQILSFVIPVPPLDEQQQICEFLESELANLDALNNQSELAIDLLKERRTALISAAVTGKIDVREAA